VPAKAGVKLNARFRVSVLPEADTEEALTLTVHWLFCSVPALPKASPLF
jgi:hypothetical protein